MKNRKGLTLIEVLLSLVLVSFIFLGSTNLFIFGNQVQKKSINEFDIQSNVRLISQSINNIIRDSSGIFLLNKDYPSSLVNTEDYLSEGWNYLMLNDDNTQLIEWVWDETKHVERIVIDSFEGITYNLTYNKKNDANKDRLLEFILDINVNGKLRTIESELEGVNTLQIIDRSYGNIANTLAYRNDPRLSEVAVAQAAVSFVIDKSGSMSNNLTGSKSRMKVLKEEATKMVEGLAEYDNIYFSITPFSGHANNSSGDKFNTMMHLKAHKDKFTEENGIINKLTPGGNTNTGDGMRRGYHSIIDYNDINNDKTIKNFMIILVDGETNRGTLTEKINNVYKESGFLISSKPFVIINERTYNYHSSSYGLFTRTHEYRWDGQTHTTYLESNINVDPITEGSMPDNTFYDKGKIVSSETEGKNYVNRIGELIKEYRNTRDDGIDVFIIGFSPDATPSGLQQIANATETTHGTHGEVYKYYKADTAIALETVLNEIKFQISEALWHIGGPN